jgi:hypothetical protein
MLGGINDCGKAQKLALCQTVQARKHANMFARNHEKKKGRSALAFSVAPPRRFLGSERACAKAKKHASGQARNK